MKRHSTSLVIRKTKIKIIRHYFTPTRMVAHVKDSNKWLGGPGETRTSVSHNAYGNVNWYSHFRQSFVSFLQS